MTLEQATYVTKVIEYYDMSLDYWM